MPFHTTCCTLGDFVSGICWERSVNLMSFVWSSCCTQICNLIKWQHQHFSSNTTPNAAYNNHNKTRQIVYVTYWKSSMHRFSLHSVYGVCVKKCEGGKTDTRPFQHLSQYGITIKSYFIGISMHSHRFLAGQIAISILIWTHCVSSYTLYIGTGFLKVIHNIIWWKPFVNILWKNKGRDRDSEAPMNSSPKYIFLFKSLCMVS